MTGNRLAGLLRPCAAADDEEIVVQMLVESACRPSGSRWRLLSS
jgi:hypothetical protein